MLSWQHDSTSFNEQERNILTAWEKIINYVKIDEQLEQSLTFKDLQLVIFYDYEIRSSDMTRYFTDSEIVRLDEDEREFFFIWQNATNPDAKGLTQLTDIEGLILRFDGNNENVEAIFQLYLKLALVLFQRYKQTVVMKSFSEFSKVFYTYWSQK